MSDLLEVIGIGRRFGGLKALDDVSFTVHQGEIVGLIGPNGAGKTTCFNVISGVIPPSLGTIRFKGRDIVGQKPNVNVRQGLVRTFQSATVFPQATVIENVVRGAFSRMTLSFLHELFSTKKALRIREAGEERCRALLERLGLAQYIDEAAGVLPYGHQRRLGIAIALAADPELLMLDEPVAGLNPEEAAEIGRLIQAIHKTEDVTVLLVEHHMKLVMGICHRIVVLDHGVKIAEGKPGAVRSDSKVIEAYLGAEDYS